MLRILRIVVIFVVMPLTAFAEESWSEYYGCFAKFSNAVDMTEPSIHGRADLIVEVLCVGEATTLASTMIQNREDLASQPFADAFESAQYAIERETKLKLFLARRSRLGI